MEFNKHFKEFPVLNTERLILRPFTLEDIDDYLLFFADPLVQKYLGDISIPEDEENAIRWVHNMSGRYFHNRTVITWCIELKSNHKVIGRIDLGGFVRKTMADIAYYLSKEYWNQGIMSEAVKAVLSYGYETLQLNRIQATVHTGNIQSINLLKKLGFKEEGLLRQYDFGRSFEDVYMYSMLKDEHECRYYSRS